LKLDALIGVSYLLTLPTCTYIASSRLSF